MKKKLFNVLSLLLVAVLLFSFASCGANGKIKGTISAFQKGCNDLNVSAIIETLDPSISGLLKVGTGFVGSLLGVEDEEIFNSLSSLLGDHADSIGIESFKSLKIKVNDVASNDSTADAKVTLTYTGLSGEEKTTDATISLKYSSEKWLISGVKFK